MNRRWILAFAALPLALLGVLASPARPAAAHPLGNFSVNQYDGLTLYPDRVVVSAVVDTAEIPTLQEKSTVDGDPAGYPGRACRELADAFEARSGDRSGPPGEASRAGPVAVRGRFITASRRPR